MVCAPISVATSAQAYTLSGCKWSSGAVPFRNLGGTPFASEVTAAAGAWNVSTHLKLQSVSSANLSVTYQNNGATGYDGLTTSTCAGGIFSTAQSRINIYYTNSYTVPMRKAVWVHEIGHGAGLGHSTFSNAIMNPCSTCPYNSFGTNTPVSDDINGMNSLY